MNPQQFPDQTDPSQQNPLHQPEAMPQTSNEASQPDQASQLGQPDTSTRGIHNPLSVMQPGEQVICEVKRHPIGLLGTYIASGFILIVLALVAFVVLPHSSSSSDHTQVVAASGLVFVLLAALILVFVFIANKVYWGNHWVVTSDSITQISQTSLFSKQSAQLSLGNLEDVTSEQNGILAQLFNFGTIKAETAGERSKFVFPFCPNPNYYAQKILAAREVFEQAHHGGKQGPYQQPQPMAYQAPATPVEQPPAGPGFSESPVPSVDVPQYQVGQVPPDFNNPPELPEGPGSSELPQSPQFSTTPLPPASGQPANPSQNQPDDENRSYNVPS